MAAVVGIVSGCDISIYTRRENFPNKSKLVLYKPLVHCNSSCSEVTQQSASVIKVGVVDIDVCVWSHLKEELTWAIDKWIWVISTIMQEYVSVISG